jgi:hypothetical protein
VQPAEPAQKFYQPAANEAVEILKSLGYVYEPTYTGLAWVAKKSAQLEQEPSQWRDMVVVTLVREGINKHRARELADHFAAQPEQEPIGWLDGTDKLAQFMHRDLKADHDKRGSATPREYTIPVYAAPPQRPWVGLTASTILNLMPSSIPADHDGALMEFARSIEAKLKKSNI